MELLEGRKGLPRAERKLSGEIAAATEATASSPAFRGFDSRRFLAHAAGLPIRTVVHIKETERDIFDGHTLRFYGIGS